MASTAEAQAAQLLQRYHKHFSDPELPVPIEAIAVDLLGLSVDEHESLDASGMLIPAERQIWLNGSESRRSAGRRRFTLAHELGHWTCQYLAGREEPTFCRAADVGVGAGIRLEREANVFAAALLMPEQLVRREAADLKVNVHALAARFGVSSPAMKVRLETLALLPEYMR
jgi:Zn-dependent peptidase ImmA (M78 family)